MRSLSRLTPLAALALTCCGAMSPQFATAQQVTTPEQHLGRPIGTDFQLADWDEVSSYYRLLGEQSPNVITEKVGDTTEGRDFLRMIISDPANLTRLDEIKAASKQLADPRGLSDEQKEQAVADATPILFISCQMHSTETAGSEFSMELAHALATSDDEPWATARDDMVVVIYTTNPDGVDHVVHWYREHVGTPYEATGLLKLYQYYSGHDNNRDWFMLTQNETRIVSEMLYKEWFPTIYWDVHQQGSSGERLFVPPYRDPLNPNLDPGIITGIDMVGTRMLMDLTREGFSGVSTGVTYDMWWNGGNRNVPVRHNIIGILTEAASVDVATPLFLPRDRLRAPGDLAGYHASNQFPDPWPGGWWRLRDIIDYQMACARSFLGTITREPGLWLSNAMEAASRTIAKGEEGSPRAWIIPSDNRDPDAVRRLIDVLLATGVEIGVSENEIEADGRTYPAGSIVVRRNQPYGTHAKDLLDVQRYPEGAPPYDVSGWTLPFLLGVRRVEVMHDLPDDLDVTMIATPDDASVAFNGDERAQDDEHSSRHSTSWTTLMDELSAGNAWTFIAKGPDAGLLVPGAQESPDPGNTVVMNGMPRIGLYSPWSGSMDEGWMRYVLDTWKTPYVSVKNEMLRAGQLHDFLDVLIIPDISGRQLDEGREPGSVPEQYTRGLSPEGAIAVEQFVKTGGTLITFDAASQWAIELFEIPLIDVTDLPDNRGFSCPGSVLRGIPQSGSSFTADLPSSMALFFSNSAAYREMTDDERKERHYPARDDAAVTIQPLMRYAPERVLLSGWINEPRVIENQYGWVRCGVGEGAVHLFGFRPQYRGWAQSTFPLVFRAALLER